MALNCFWIGIHLFFVFIGIAMIRYPGGNRFDHHFPHFSFQGNYLCDLFDRFAYNTIQNDGRYFAYIGAYALALTFLLFWNLVPQLFNHLPKSVKYVRLFGSSAMIISLLIATPLHDGCILLAIPLGMVAFILTIDALFKSGEKLIAYLGGLSAAMCVLNYFSLILHPFPEILPGQQKLTLIVFLAWVISAMVRLKKLQGLQT